MSIPNDELEFAEILETIDINNKNSKERRFFISEDKINIQIPGKIKYVEEMRNLSCVKAEEFYKKRFLRRNIKYFRLKFIRVDNESTEIDLIFDEDFTENRIFKIINHIESFANRFNIKNDIQRKTIYKNLELE